ncbi:MAG: hypothetical protein K8R77_08655 [Anaerolineaceae bacterium]|nr:hypothetical protein [Anaerolineaceae bacterium]
MKTLNWKMILGIGLLLLGGLTLLDTFNLIPGMENVWGWTMACVFGLGGAAFLYALTIDRQENWWAVIPGMELLGLGLTIAVSAFPGLEQLGGMIFLGSISAAFWIIYLMSHNHWWSIIPGGVLATLAVVAGAEGVLSAYSGVVFFLGLSLTFALLALLPTGDVKMKWPWIPAAVLFALASVLALSAENLLQYLWPVGLILVGLYLVGRTFLKKE